MMTAVPTRARRSAGAQFFQQFRHEEQNDRQGTGKNDLLIEGNTAKAHDQGENRINEASAEQPPVGVNAFTMGVEQFSDTFAGETKTAQFPGMNPLQNHGGKNPEHRHHRNDQRHFVNADVDGSLLGPRHGIHPAEHDNVHHGNQDAAAHDGHPPKGLHGRVHELHGLGVERGAGVIHQGNRFHGHGIGHHVLDDVTERGQQHTQDKPCLHAHGAHHHRVLAEQTEHDGEAYGNESRAQENQHRLPPPNQVHQVPQGHLQGPRDAGPKPESRQEFRRESEVVLDEKGPHDAGQARNAGRHVNHERRQIRDAHLADQFHQIGIDPLPESPGN